MLKITVPASSANLGAGFDALGLALTLYNRVWMEEADGCRIETTDGAAVPLDESNMIYHTARLLYARCGRPFRGLHILQENNIPMTRGLGSSSACLVAGLLGANTLLGSPQARSGDRAGGASGQRGPRPAGRAGHLRHGRRAGAHRQRSGNRADPLRLVYPGFRAEN